MKRQEHVRQLVAIAESSDILREIIHKAGLLGLGSYYIGAGCITQTVWNHLTGRSLTYGITDIDLVYYDDVKNQARVHLWYESKFGIRPKPYRSLEEAIATWPTTASAVGVRKEHNEWHVCAPYGLEYLFNLTLRPNKRLITQEIYEQKAVKWKSKWPELNVTQW